MAAFTYEQFVSDLRSALRYLYDPVHLRRSPLVSLFGLDGEFDPASALQNLLSSTIRTMKPAEDEPPLSAAWHIYDILNLQYVRQSSRDLVAGQLGISERQLRREQRLALEALAQVLWKNRVQTGSLRLPDFSSPPAPEAVSADPKKDAPEPEGILAGELAWLKDPAFQQYGSLAEVFETIQELARQLSNSWQAPLQASLPDDLADLPVLHMVLRNILLTILSVVIPRARQAPVKLSAALSGGGLELSVACIGQGGAPQSFNKKEETSMQAARNIAGLYDLTILVHEQGECFEVQVIAPAPQQVPILVIDDNADWHDLLKRYAVGSRYRVMGTRDPNAATALVRGEQPAAIFLDVMMPNIDGWQVLSALRNDQAVGNIPIVICSILPLEELALSLGVTAFLQKPVTQEQFLAVLDRMIL